jgi:hypothetical protein
VDEPLLLLKLLSKVFEVGGSIVVLRCKRLLFKCAIINDLLGGLVLSWTLLEVLTQKLQLVQVFLFHFLDTLEGGRLIVGHVLVPRLRKLIKLSTLNAFQLKQLLLLSLNHSRKLSFPFMRLELL